MKLVNEFLEQVPESPLYHYTNANGLIGILRSKTIWASSIHHLNDTQEYKHAVGMISDELKKRIDEVNPFTLHPGHPIESLHLLQENLHSLEKTTVYVASFSEQKDVLSQWRGYCKEGDGYSIGFMPQILTCLNGKGHQLVKCVYRPEDQRSLCNALIDSYLEIDAKFVGKRTLWRHGSKSEWRTKFSLLAAAIKHEGFQEEVEWRLVGKEDDNIIVEFRSGRSGVVPYIEIRLVEDETNVPVAELVIGPTDDKEASLIGARKIMERYACKELTNRLFPSRPISEPLQIASPGLVDYLITPSTTPYRN
jgi:hypothetical protein